MDVWQVTQAEDAVYQVTIRDGNGDPITTYSGAEPLTVSVWPGDDQAPITGVATAAWAVPSSGTINVMVAGSATTAMMVGKYRLKVLLNDSGASRDVFEACLEILWSPGSASTLPVYCQYTDMLAYAPWLSSTADLLNSEAGFLEQRHMARTWLEQRIQNHYRLQAATGMTTFGWPVPVWGPIRTGSNDKVLQDYLDANLLMTAPPRRVTEITAKYALGLVLQAQLTGVDARDSLYQKKAEWYLVEANELTKSYHAEIDLNNDGYPEITIHCGSVDVLYG